MMYDDAVRPTIIVANVTTSANWRKWNCMRKSLIRFRRTNLYFIISMEQIFCVSIQIHFLTPATMPLWNCKIAVKTATQKKKERVSWAGYAEEEKSVRIESLSIQDSCHCRLLRTFLVFSSRSALPNLVLTSIRETAFTIKEILRQIKANLSWKRWSGGEGSTESEHHYIKDELRLCLNKVKLWENHHLAIFFSHLCHSNAFQHKK